MFCTQISHDCQAHWQILFKMSKMHTYTVHTERSVILTLPLRRPCVRVLSGKHCQSGLEVQCCEQMGDKTLSAATFTANHHQWSASPTAHTKSSPKVRAHTHTRSSDILNNLTHTDIETETHLN